MATAEDGVLADDDGFLAEQPILETDPSGRYSRVRPVLVLRIALCFMVTCVQIVLYTSPTQACLFGSL